MNAAEPMVPFERVRKMVRLLTHDVRSRLSGLQLQAANVTELLADPKNAAEAIHELKRLRGYIEEQAKALKVFARRFGGAVPAPVRYPARSFTEDFRQRLAREQPKFAPLVEWSERLADEAISVDPEMIFTALGEFFQNAAHFREDDTPVAAHAGVKADRFFITLRERKTELPSTPAGWGTEPLTSTRPDGFGLGIFHARQLLAEHGGRVEFAHDPAAALLTTRVSLPLAA